jgi:hypothetical protein
MDRIAYEVVHEEGDSSSRIEEIDMHRYANESLPKGYARTAPVSEDACPTCAASTDDPRFHNER